MDASISQLLHLWHCGRWGRKDEEPEKQEVSSVKQSLLERPQDQNNSSISVHISMEGGKFFRVSPLDKELQATDNHW